MLLKVEYMNSAVGKSLLFLITSLLMQVDAFAIEQSSTSLTPKKRRPEFVIVIGVDPMEWNFDPNDWLGVRNLISQQVPYLRKKFDAIGIDLRVQKHGLAQILADELSKSSTVGLIWIGHGDEQGNLIDAANRDLPSHIFHQASYNLQYLGIGACYSSSINLSRLSNVEFQKTWASQINTSQILVHLLGEVEFAEAFESLKKQFYRPPNNSSGESCAEKLGES